MNGEISRRGLGTESIQKPGAFEGVLENLVAIEAADRYEIELPADVVGRRQADTLVVKHGEEAMRRIVTRFDECVVLTKSARLGSRPLQRLFSFVREEPRLFQPSDGG
jgi:hypothetical protein